MPVIYVIKEDLFKAVGKSFTDEEFEDICFDFGLEIDKTTTKDLPHRDILVGNGEDKEVYKVEVSANRIDLLSAEGLAYAIKCYVNNGQLINYTLKPSKEKIIVKAATEQIRPFVVCAILRNIKLDEKSYNSLISLQDKLHQNICRKRALAAIGTHDYDKIKGPFTFDAKAPKDILFAPLNHTEQCTGEGIMKLYENDMALKQYLPIIKDSPVYPVIYDSNGVVLSLPPIINGNHSKITLDTKNMFIEITATDLARAKTALNVLVTAFSEYCSPKYEIECVDVVYEKASKVSVLPNFAREPIEVNIKYARTISSIEDLTCEQMVTLLKKMCLNAKVKDSENIIVDIPPNRPDVLHACDIVEDIIIAYGINKIQMETPKISTIGKQLPLAKLSNALREEIVASGYNEFLTLALTSKETAFTMMRQPFNADDAVIVANPKIADNEMVRLSLIPGLLCSVFSNKDVPWPLKIFEVGDVVMKTKSNPSGAKNVRMMCLLIADAKSRIDLLHGMLDMIMEKLKMKPKEDYSLVLSNSAKFIDGSQAQIMLKGKKLGEIGIIHPEVLNSFSLPCPCTVLELNVEMLEEIMVVH
jgi:phenylalanyl-tRNA synthetase beta chain